MSGLTNIYSIRYRLSSFTKTSHGLICKPRCGASIRAGKIESNNTSKRITSLAILARDSIIFVVKNNSLRRCLCGCKNRARREPDARDICSLRKTLASRAYTGLYPRHKRTLTLEYEVCLLFVQEYDRDDCLAFVCQLCSLILGKALHTKIYFSSAIPF